MIGYLLDTSIVSIMDPTRGILTPAIEAWFMVREPRVYLSTVTIFETTQGIHRLSLADKHQRAAALTVWADGIVDNFGGRILPLDLEVAKIAGRLSALAFANGDHPGVADIMIAATAQLYDLLLLTRNVRHFEPLGIAVADPTVKLPA